MGDYVDELLKKQDRIIEDEGILHKATALRRVGGTRRASSRTYFKTKKKSETKSNVAYYTHLDYVQMLKIELAKAYSVEHDVVDAIYHDGVDRGVKPFTLMLMKTLNDSIGLKYKPHFEVKTDNPLRFMITWNHQTPYPSFITYSTLPFKWEGEDMRFADIDIDELGSYVSEDLVKKFEGLIVKVSGCNVANRLLDWGDLNTLQSTVREMGDSIMSDISPEKIYFSGRGFRILLPAKEDLFDELVGAKKLCKSSQVGYQSMRIFSVKISSPHLQTDIPYDSDKFRFSNPSFFVFRKNDELAAVLQRYYKSWLRTHNKDVDYLGFRDRQMDLEKKIFELHSQ